MGGSAKKLKRRLSKNQFFSGSFKPINVSSEQQSPPETHSPVIPTPTLAHSAPPPRAPKAPQSPPSEGVKLRSPNPHRKRRLSARFSLSNFSMKDSDRNQRSILVQTAY